MSTPSSPSFPSSSLPVSRPGMVHFIGAGPGDPELITLKGQRLIREAALVLYAGSLVPSAVVAEARPDARVVDSSPLCLEETHALIRETALNGGSVARVHTGDPGLYGTVREQARLLDADGSPWDVIPGVSAAFAAAATAGVSLTVPEATQSLIITRLEGRTPVPDSEKLSTLAAHGTSMAIYLSAGDPEGVQNALLAALPAETTVICAYRAGWPDQALVKATVGTLAAVAREKSFTRQTVFLVLPGENPQHQAVSRLYAADFSHSRRQARTPEK